MVRYKYMLTKHCRAGLTSCKIVHTEVTKASVRCILDSRRI